MEAMASLRGLPNAGLVDRSFAARRHGLAVRDLAANLRSQGWTYSQIAGELGLTKSTVANWLAPNRGEWNRVARRRRRQRDREARDALRRQERDRAMRKADPDDNRVYTLIRKALEEAERAEGATDNPEKRAVLRETLAHLHRAEDAIYKRHGA